METNRKGVEILLPVVRWSARLIGVLLSSFFVFMFVGESLQPPTRLAEPIKPFTVVSMVLMAIYCVAMFLALRWERLGTLLGAGAFGLVNVMVVLSLFPSRRDTTFFALLALIWIPILLYVTCWRLEESMRKRATA